MDEVEYVLRIVLRARDEMALVLSKAREQIRGFTADANAMNTSVEGLNKSMKKFDKNMDNITNKLREWRAVLRDGGKDSDHAAASLDGLGKSAERTVASTKKAAEANKAYRKTIEELGDSFVRLNDDYERGLVTRKDYIKDLERIGREYDALSKKSKVGTDLSRALRKAGDEARYQAKMLVIEDKERRAAEAAHLASLKKQLAEEEKRAAAAKKADEADRARILTQKQLQVRARELRDEIIDVKKARQDEAISAKFAASQYDRLSRKLEEISLKMTKAARERTPAHVWAEQATDAAEEIRETNKQITDDAVAERKRREAVEADLERKRLATVKRHNDEVGRLLLQQIEAETKAANDHAKDLEDIEKRRIAMVRRQNAETAALIDQQITAEAKAASDREKALEDIEKRRIAMVRRHNAETARLIDQQIDAEVKAAKDREAALEDIEKRRVAMVRRQNAEAARLIDQQIDEEARAAKESERIAKQSDADADFRDSVQRERQRQRRETATPAEVRALAAGYDKLANSYSVNSHEARTYRNEAERLRLTLRNTVRDTDRQGSALSRLSAAFRNNGKSVAGFDNQLRGMGIFAAVLAIDNLISAVIALGGELVSLAGSAVMAGGALGGILAAGAAQALPVIGLVMGAAQRAMSVFKAFQQQQKLQQAESTDATKGAQKQIDKTNALVNAQEAQADAQDRLADSRKALNQANKDGVDQLEDLIYAEKSAALAARGASLNVEEAQKALQDAIRGGASALEIRGRQQALDEAKLSQGRSRVTARRATRERQQAGGKVENLESVQSAAKAVDDAEQALGKANRALDLAEDKTDRVASSTMTAAANLKYLLSQLSPAERRLYESFKGFYENYKRIFQGTKDSDGIYGVIVDSFTRAVDKVNDIIQMPDVIKTITGLATEISKQIDKIVGSFTTPKSLDQLQRIIKDAGKNLGPVVDLAIELAHAFLDIAEAANPALQDLLKYLGDIVGKFTGLTGDSDKMEKFFSDGEEHLESWLDLLWAVIGLFAALTGASAESGQKSIDDLTEKIKGWTDWIKDHKEEVVAFFEDARKAAYAIGGVLEKLVVMLGKTFSADRVEKLADIFNNILTPAFEQILELSGKITDFIAKIAENETAADVAKWAIAFAVFGKIANGVVGIVGKLLKPLERLWELLKFLKFDKLLKLMRILVPASGEAGAAGALAVNPIVLIIGAIIAAIALLLHHFGRLDDVWEGMKDTFKSFMDDISPSIDRLKEALEGIGADGETLKKIWEGVQVAGQFLADFIAKYLVEQFKAAGKILSGVFGIVISNLAGLIKIIHGVIDIIDGLFHWDKEKMAKGVNEVLDGITDILKGWIEGVLDILDGLVKGAMTPFQALWDAIKNALDLGDLTDSIVEGVLDPLVDLADKILGVFVDAWKGILRFFRIASPSGLAKDLGKSIVDGLISGIKSAGRAIGSVAEWVWDRWVRYIRLAIRGWKAIGDWVWTALSDGIHAVGNKLESLGTRVVNAIIKGIKAAPDAIKAAIDWLIDKAGPAGGAIRAGLKLVGVETKAAGGPVGGSGSGDTVPALLTPGEHVLTKGEVAAAGGHDVIFAIRRMLGGGGQGGPYGYAIGGYPYAVGGSPLDRSDVQSGASTFSAARVKAQQDQNKRDREKEKQERQADLQTQREDYKRSGTQRAQDWHTMWNDMLVTTRRYANDIEKQIRDMRVNTTRTFLRMSRDIISSLDGVVEAWEDTWQGLMKVTHDGLNYIGHETNQALKALGEDTINFHLTAPSTSKTSTTKATNAAGKVMAVATGGVVGNLGQRGRDRGLYALGAGEAVLNWAHQRYVEPAMNAFYGHGLGEMFGRVRGYHAGGPEQAGFAAGTPGHASVGGGKWVANEALARTVLSLMRRYKFQITAAGEQGHSTNSDHHWGGALDLVPGAGGTWGDLDKLAKAAGWRPNAPMPTSGPFRWIGWDTESGHGQPPRPNAHLHLSWNREGPWTGPGGSGGGGGAVTAAIDAIASKVVTPRTTATARLVQAAFERVVAGANKKVTAGASTTDTTGAGVTVSGASAAEKVFNFFTGHGLSEAIAAGFAGVFQKESNFSTSVLNARGSGAQGLAQWLDVRLDKLKQKKNWQSIQTQLDYVWEELQGSESGAFAAIKTAKSPAEAARIIDAKYERSDGLLSAPENAENWYKRFAKGKAMGGPIEGPDGAPVPILAHAGEWVLNRGQQLRAAMLAGLSPAGLKAMLGFGGGPTSFAKGGEVLLVGDSLGKGIEDAIKKAFKNAVTDTDIGISSTEAVKRLKANYKEAFKSIVFDAGTNDDQAKTFGKNLKKAYKLLHEDQELIVPTLKGGPQAAAKNKLLKAFAAANKNVEIVDTTGIPLGADKLHPVAGGYTEIAKLIGSAIRSAVSAGGAAGGAPTKGTPYRVAPVTTFKTLMDDVSDTWKGITAIAGVMKRVKTDKIKKGDANKVGIAYKETIGLIDNIIGSAGIGAIAEEIQKHVSQAATKLKRATFQIGPGGVVARKLGAGGVLDRELSTMVQTTQELVGEKSVILGSLKQVNKQINKITKDKTITENRRMLLLQQLEGQRKILLGEQERIDNEIADSIEARFQKQIEVQQNAVDEINKRAESTAKALDLAKRIATAYGNTDLIGSLNQQIADNLNNQMHELEGRIAMADAAGATDLANQLREQVGELRAQVVDATMQIIKDAGDAVSQAAGRERTKLDLFSRMADALGVVGQMAAAAIPGLGGMSRSQILQGRVSADTSERAGLIAVRDRAAQAGNIGYVQELTDKINELTVTIAEGNKAIFDARVSEVTTRHDYTNSMTDLELQLVDLDGAISGNTDYQKKATLLGDKDRNLRAKGNELTALLAEATPDTQAYLDLKKAILENEIATRQNTQALNEATGAGMAPSSFSSTLQQWFGQALLTGTGGGNILPQYNPSLGAAFTGNPSMSLSSTTNNGSTIVNNFEINEAGQPIDTTKLASNVVFAQSSSLR